MTPFYNFFWGAWKTVHYVRCATFITFVYSDTKNKCALLYSTEPMSTDYANNSKNIMYLLNILHTLTKLSVMSELWLYMYIPSGLYGNVVYMTLFYCTTPLSINFCVCVVSLRVCVCVSVCVRVCMGMYVCIGICA